MALLKAQIKQEIDQINVPDENGYLRVPYDFCKAAKRISDCLVRSMIYSFSCVKERPDARCAMSYSRFQDKLHYSRSTVNAAIHAATENGAFDQDKSNRFRASYKYLPPAQEGESNDGTGAFTLPSFTVEFYLLHTAFIGKDDQFHYLPKSAALVLGLIKTHYENGGFVGSVRGIALTLGLSPTTVQKAINLLMDLSLVFRPKERRGVNCSRRSAYAVNEKLLRKAERTFKKQLKSRSSAADDPEEWRIERERYYARLQQAEKERVENFEHTLNSDSRYFALDRRRRTLEIEMAKAEVFMPLRLPAIEEELRQINVDRARCMAQIGISEEDLKPKFLCPKCEDTGYNKSDGRICDCFPKRRRT